MTPHAAAVHRDSDHRFSKTTVDEIELLAGIGVKGDAHAGVTVKHRSRVAKDPTQPNLRQVHLIPTELFDRVNAAGFTVSPGELGENITTTGVDLYALSAGSHLAIGNEAVVEVTGLRNPCGQINGLAEGLLAEVRGTDGDGSVVREAGIMAIVVTGGVVRAGDVIEVHQPEGPHRPLERV